MNERLGGRLRRLATTAGAFVAASVIASAAAMTAAHAGEPAEEEVVEPAGISVAFGPLVAGRDMQLRAGGETLSHEPGVYFGGTGRLSVELVDFESVDARLLLEGRGGYGATRNSRAADELSREPVTEYSFLDARLAVRRPLTEAVAVDVGLGASATSFIVEPNLTYTGHRYVAAEARVGLRWAAPSSDWTAAAQASAYPVLSVDESAGADGAASAFGARAGAEVGYKVAPVPSSGGYVGGRFVLRYDHTRFRSQFRQTRDGGVSEDAVHALTLLFEFSL